MTATVASQSIQPTTKPATSPNARREYTLNPPASGYMAASSDTETAPMSAYTAPAHQQKMIRVGLPAASATMPGKRRIPTPTIVPKANASPNPRPRILRSGRAVAMCAGGVIGFVTGRNLDTPSRTQCQDYLADGRRAQSTLSRAPPGAALYGSSGIFHRSRTDRRRRADAPSNCRSAAAVPLSSLRHELHRPYERRLRRARYVEGPRPERSRVRPCSRDLLRQLHRAADPRGHAGRELECTPRDCAGHDRLGLRDCAHGPHSYGKPTLLGTTRARNGRGRLLSRCDRVSEPLVQSRGSRQSDRVLHGRDSFFASDRFASGRLDRWALICRTPGMAMAFHPRGTARRRSWRHRILLSDRSSARCSLAVSRATRMDDREGWQRSSGSRGATVFCRTSAVLPHRSPAGPCRISQLLHQLRILFLVPHDAEASIRALRCARGS